MLYSMYLHNFKFTMESAVSSKNIRVRQHLVYIFSRVRIRDRAQRRGQNAGGSSGIVFPFRNLQISLPALRHRQSGQSLRRKVLVHHRGSRLSHRRSIQKKNLGRGAQFREIARRLFSVWQFESKLELGGRSDKLSEFFWLRFGL